MKRRLFRLAGAAACAALALALGAAALGQSDSLVSLDYLTDTFIPSLVGQGAEAADKALTGTYDAALDRLEALAGQAGQGGAGGFDLRDYTRGDTVALGAGSGFYLQSGQAAVTHNGAFIDVTAGAEVPSGAALAAGHRYLAGEDTSAVVTIRSGLAGGGAEGAYTRAPGGQQAAPFTDVTGEDWYCEAVDYAYFGGLFAGMGDGTFAPGGDMDRAMMMTVLYHLAGSPEEERLSAPAAFRDVPEGQWYYSFVNWAYAQGVSAGTGDGEFSPTRSVTREQVVVLLHNFALNYMDLSLDEGGDLSAYADGEQVAFWAYDAMAWAARTGVAGTPEGGALEPGRPAARAEVASMLMNFSKVYLAN